MSKEKEKDYLVGVQFSGTKFVRVSALDEEDAEEKVYKLFEETTIPVNCNDFDTYDVQYLEPIEESEEEI